MTAPAVYCTQPGCREPAAARVGLPLLPLPPGVGLGFLILWPLAHTQATGLPMCVDCAHHAVDLMLLTAQPRPGVQS